jgi:hypothetical protein
MTTTLTPTTTGTDQHGNPMQGGAEAIERYDRAIDRLLRFHPDVISELEGLIEHHGDAPMTQVLAAHLSLMSTDTADLADAQGALEALRGMRLDERSEAHAVAIDRWLRGDWRGAADQLDLVLRRWPSDLLALSIGHQLDFFLGESANLRDRVERSLGTVDPAHPHHGFMLGMHSFGLEEYGTYDAAEQAGMEAVRRNPDDVWAIHAVAHVHEMRGDLDAGLGFMSTSKEDWADGHLFTVHLWWHFALYLLEAGRIPEVLGVYDEQVHHAGSDGVPIEMLDASSLLWRLRLAGVDTGDRFERLADAWARVTDADPWYVFNDVHAVMASAGAGRMADARSQLDRLSASVDAPVGSAELISNRTMTAEVGLPVARAMLAHAEGRFDDAVDELWPVRRIVHRFGGSHAQRDVVEQTLVDAAVGSGQVELAAALLRERLNRRPTNVFALERAGRLETRSVADQRP